MGFQYVHPSAAHSSADVTVFPTFVSVPVSPHRAASMTGTRIHLETIVRPDVAAPLVIEGAGGVLVPLNDRELMIDLMRQLAAPVVIAARTTLGTINHTLLTIRAVRAAALEIKGVVMLGDANGENRRAVEHYGDVRVIGHIPFISPINRAALLDIWRRNFSL